jgi:Carboxypeptidase regulatory-like domain
VLMKTFSCLTLVGSLTLLFYSTRVFAQSNEGIIAGTVLDPSGAAIEGADVTARSEATGLTRKTTTGSGGNFRFPSLLVGTYDLTVAHTGFRTVTQSDILVQINTTTSAAITLPVGEASQSVTVSAEGTRVQAESSDIGTVISTRQVVELPLALGGVGALRSPEAFVFLAPGTSRPGNRE